MKTLKKWVLTICFGQLFCCTSSVAEITVLSSIKPVSLLVEAIGGQHVNSRYLVPAGVSPHNFALRPSHRLQLERSDVLFWVGPDLEFYVDKVLKSQRGSIAAVALGGDHDRHSHGEKHSGHDAGKDPHQWLDPLGGIAWAEQIAETLIKLDPDNQQAYRQALSELREQLLTLDAELQQSLGKVRDRGFVVMHNAYSHFVERYQLRQLAVYSPSPDRTPGARHIAELQALTTSGEVVCLFTEVQANSKGFLRLSEEGGIKIAELDLMAVNTREGSQAYPDFIESFAQRFNDCLVAQ